MKINRTTYILIIVTAIIWGGFIYLVISDKAEDIENQENYFADNNSKPKELKSDTFSLLLSYSDPFLRGVSIQTDYIPVRPSATTMPKPEPVKMIVTTAPWASIKFSGSIKNQNSNKTVALITVNGQSLLLAQGDKFLNEYVLSKLTSDSIEVTRAKEKKIFKR